MRRSKNTANLPLTIDRHCPVIPAIRQCQLGFQNVDAYEKNKRTRDTRLKRQATRHLFVAELLRCTRDVLNISGIHAVHIRKTASKWGEFSNT